MQDIPGFSEFKTIEPIHKGWSSDKKYHIETKDGRHLLLRISDISEYERKKAEYAMLSSLAHLSIPMSSPISFGLHHDGQSIFSLLNWCEGISANELLPSLSPKEQYTVGINAGSILKKIHTLPPIPENVIPWHMRFRQKLDGNYAFIAENGIKDESIEMITAHLEENFFLLDDRPQSFHHGDFNPGNLIVGKDLGVSIIDPNSYNLGYGDPYWEFVAIDWENELITAYYSGLIDGYFDHNPPPGFFKLFAYYFAFAALSTFYEAHDLGLDRSLAIGFARKSVYWFDEFKNPVPSWYKSAMCHLR